MLCAEYDQRMEQIFYGFFFPRSAKIDFSPKKLSAKIYSTGEIIYANNSCRILLMPYIR